jgi:HEAT repeat protein
MTTVLAGTHEGARTRAAYALRKIASPAAAASLFRCLNDPNYMVHTYAYEGLDELGLLDNLLLVP